MSAIINDRDKAIQSGGPRITATSVVIAGTNTIIINKKNGVGLTPTSITLTAITSGFPADGSAATYVWEYSLLTSPDTWIVVVGNTNTTVILGTTLSELFQTYGSIRYRVTASQSGGYLTSTSPTYVINYSKETDDESRADISSQTVLVSASSDGLTLTPNPAPDSGVAITVKVAYTEIPFKSSGANSFSVSVVPTNVSLGAITSAEGALAYTRDNITGMSGNTASAIYTITVRNAVGAVSATYTLTQTFTKVLAVAANTPYIHDLTPPLIGLPIDIDGNVTSYTEAKAKYTIIQGTVDRTTEWALTKSDYLVNSTLDSSGNLQITSLAVSDFIDGYVDITATKAPDFPMTKRVVVKKGSKTNPVVVVTITPKSSVLPANSTGKVLDYSNTSVIKIKVTENGTDTTSSWTASISSSVTMTYTGNLTAGYALTSVPDASDTGTTTFTLTKTGMASQTCTFTYTKYKGVQVAGPTNNSFQSFSTSTGYLAIQWKNDGWVYAKDTSGGSFTTKLTSWYTIPAAGVGASYWLKVTNTGAALGGSATGSYHQISTEPSFFLDNTAGASPSSLSSNLTMSLSSTNNDSGLYGVSSTATITANKV